MKVNQHPHMIPQCQEMYALPRYRNHLEHLLINPEPSAINRRNLASQCDSTDPLRGPIALFLFPVNMSIAILTSSVAAYRVC